MIRRTAAALILWLAAALSYGGIAEAPSHLRAAGVTLELVSGVQSIQPGEPFFVGLHLKHDPGYHTYWKNPGLAGVATQIEWDLPEGFQADPILWPAPEKVKMANLNTHGYEKDALLVIRITPPRSVPGGRVRLTAKAVWMCCATSCHPGHGTLSVALPVSADAPEPTPWQERIDAVWKAQPPPASGWKFTAVRDGGEILFRAVPEKPGTALPAEPQFFSEDGLVCSDPEQHWEMREGVAECRLTVSEFPPSDQSRLRGLLRGRGGWNPDNAAEFVRIDLPLEEADSE